MAMLSLTATAAQIKTETRLHCNTESSMRVLVTVPSHDSKVPSSSSHEPPKVAGCSLLKLAHHILQTTDSTCEQIEQENNKRNAFFDAIRRQFFLFLPFFPYSFIYMYVTPS